MNKFIQNTKLFFNKKPVRIVVALLVIAAIMTGVAFGIMALVGAFKNPCQSGYYYDNNLNVCVKDSCQNICKTGGRKGSCDDDMCTGSNEEGYPYVYDGNLCECVLDCSTAGPAGDGQDLLGRIYTSFAVNGNGQKSTAINNGIPEEPLTCAIQCDLSGKTQYCNSNTVCGKNVTESSGIDGINGDSDGGCFPYPKYKLCKEKNPNFIACYQWGNDIQDNNCIRDSNEEAISCKVSQCNTSANEDSIVIADKSEDCDSGDYTPIQSLGKQTIKNSAGGYINKDFSKFSPSSHYCKSTTKIAASNTRCMTMSGLSEYKNDQGVPTLYDCNHTHTDKTLGVSRYTPQCKKSIDNFGCINSGYSLCENGWQATPNKQGTYCLSDTEGSPTGNWSYAEDEYCCSDGTRITNPVGKYECCNIENPDKYCFRKTPGPYDISLISGDRLPLYTPGKCSLNSRETILTESDSGDDTNIKKYSNNLRNLVCGTSSSCSSDIESDNYVGIICESTYEDDTPSGPYYKGVAGKANKLKLDLGIYANGKQGSYPETYQIAAKSNCKANIQPMQTSGNGYIPVCTNSDNPDKDDNTYYWYPPLDGSSLYNLRQYQTLSFQNDDNSPCTQGVGSFNEEIANKINGLDTIKYINDNTYELKYDCSKIGSDLPIKSDSRTKQTKFVKWKDMNPVSHSEIEWNQVFKKTPVSCNANSCNTLPCSTNGFNSNTFNNFVIPTANKTTEGTCAVSDDNKTIKFAADGEYCLTIGVNSDDGKCNYKK